MKISYKKLWLMLVEREVNKASFRKELGLSAGTYTKLNRNEEFCFRCLDRDSG